MKRKFYAGMGLGLAILLSACGEHHGMPQTSGERQEAEQTVQAVEPALEESQEDLERTAAVIGNLLDMLGKTDAEAEEIMKGEQNFAGDGTLIGRIYEIELFDEPVSAGTIYDADQRVITITMQLKNPEAEAYEESLTQLFGQPQERETAESESGSTYVAWHQDHKTIRLYQSFGLVSLEFQLLSDMTERSGPDA